MENPSKNNKDFNTEPLLLFMEEANMFKKLGGIFAKSNPNKSQLMQNPNYKIYEEVNLKGEDSEDDDDEMEFEEQEKMATYYKYYPNTYGYYPYYQGTKTTTYTNQNTQSRYKYNYSDGGTTQHKTKDPYYYSSYYNNKYGKKVRVVRIRDINDRLGNHNNDQYWNGRVVPEHQQENKDIINNISTDPNRKKLDLNSTIKKLIVSNLVSKITKKERTEEEEGPDDVGESNIPGGVIQNSVINSVTYLNRKNQIDDLQELLTNSTLYTEAKQNLVDGKYNDPLFVGNADAIMGFGDRKDYTMDELNTYIWIRPEEFFQGEQVTLFKKISSNDILQGGLGDCYFLAAISAIAEYPERLERLFLTKEYDPDGVYVVAMCITGVWQDIVLDDTFPCQPYSKKPIFNTSKSGELWVMLLEKAWAKVHGGYMNIAAGLTREALRDLTGACAKTFFTAQDREGLWARMMEADDGHFIMTAGSDDLNNGSDSLIEKIGIAGSHAYSLLAVFEFENIDGQYRNMDSEESREGKEVERVVKLRNPWGQGEWKGEWSDDSPLWNDHLKEAVGWKDEDDGIFFMNYNDFCKYYSDIQICYFHDDFKYSAITIESSKEETTYLKFNIEVEGKYYLSINQKNKRMFAKINKYKYSELNFLVCRIGEDGSVSYIGGGKKTDKENWFSNNLSTGEYLVLVKTPWVSFVNEFSLSVYGIGDIDIQKVDGTDIPKDIHAKMFHSHGLKDTETEFFDLSGQGHPEMKYKTFDNKGGFGYIFFENGSTDKSLETVVEFAGSVNITLCHPFSGLRPSITIPPGKTDVIVYEGMSLPYAAQMRFMSNVKGADDGESLKEEVRASPTILRKNHLGSDVDARVHVLYHADGMAMLYINETEDLTMCEEIEFNMTGCHIEGAYGSYLEIVVPPKSEKMLKVVKNEGADSFEASIKKLYYNFK